MPSLITRSSEERHVAIFPFPFTSNPFAFCNLVHNLAIAAPNVLFSFFSTSKSNKFSLSARNSNIRTYTIDYELSDEFKKVPEYFKKGINAAEIETGKRITCFITDAFFSLPVCKMAQDRNVPWISLWAASPSSPPPFFHWDLLHYLYINAEAYQIGDQMLKFNFNKMFEMDLIDPIESNFSLNQITSIVMNSFQELNSDILAYYFKPKFQKVLYLSALKLSGSSYSWLGDNDNGCLSWLDRQKSESVAYISFGTGVGFPVDEIKPLAEALESSRIPFLWVLKDELKDYLPEGFPDRVKGKVVSWAPQNQVLKHPSVGVYITHCGSNSVYESILGGVPMICRSILADNHIISKMIEQVWGNGIRVEDGKITKSGIIKSLEIIFSHDQGKKIRANANNIKEVVLNAAPSNDSIGQDFKTLVQIISGE